MTQVKKISLMGFIVLLMVNFAYMADLAIIPAFGNIYGAFPDAPSWVINFIFSGTQLTALLATLLSAVIMRYFSKKTIIVVSFALFTVAACLGVAVMNPYYIALMRGIAGFAFGGLVPSALALINEIYHEDEKKSGMLIGFFNGSMAFIGAIMSIVGGYLAVTNWTHAFYQYYAAIPMLILMIIFLPKTPPQKETLAQIPQKAAFNEKMPWGTALAILFSFFIMNLLYCFMTYLSSPYVLETGLGNEILAGNLGFALSIAGGCGGFLFVKSYGFFKRGTSVVAYLCMAIAYTGFAFAPSILLLYLFYILMGFGFGTSISFFYVHAARVIPHSHAPQMFSFVAAAMGLGAFLATYVVTWLGTLLGTASLVALCPYYAGVAAIGTILALMLTIRYKKLGLDKVENNEQL